MALTRDQNGENHGRLLQFMDADGRNHQWAMPMELLAGDGNEYRRNLLSMGLQIAPGRKARELLTTYIQTTEPQLKAMCVNRIGWMEEIYVFPDESIGLRQENESVFFQSLSPQKSAYQIAGTLEEWQKRSVNIALIIHDFLLQSASRLQRLFLKL